MATAAAGSQVITAFETTIATGLTTVSGGSASVTRLNGLNAPYPALLTVEPSAGNIIVRAWGFDPGGHLTPVTPAGAQITWVAAGS